MLREPSCDVGCLVNLGPLGCILDLLVNAIWRAFYKWSLGLGLGVESITLLKELVIMLHWCPLHGVCVGKMVICIGCGPTLKVACWA